MAFHAEKDLALCGLACVLCSSDDCPGCKARGCTEVSDCAAYKCAAQKRLDGCYQCGECPCGEGMLQGTRNRAFNRYAREHGKEALLERLKHNYESGVIYHRPGGLKGDYDVPDAEDDIMRLIQYGFDDPYAMCPAFETEHFTLRLLRQDDADALLACYADPAAQPFFNADNCLFGFEAQTIEDMRRFVTFWLQCYEGRGFIRYTIVDNASGKAVGTIEIFAGDDPGFGVYRLDIASAYETRSLLGELIEVARTRFHTLLRTRRFVTKAVPEAAERVAALQAHAFTPYDIPGREHYWAHEAEG